MQIAISQGGEPITMTSVELVEFINVSEGRDDLTHANFLPKVPKVLGEEGLIHFQDTYVHPQNGQTYPCYRFPKREACLMAMSYSYDLQAKVFDRMTALEAAQKPAAPDLSNPIALRALLLSYTEQVIELQQTIEDQRPAVEFVDRFVEAKSAKGLREVSKILGRKEREFIGWLSSTGIIFKQGNYWLPKAMYQHAGYFEVKTGETNGHAFTQMRFTPSGVAWIAARVAKHDAEVATELKAA